MNEYTFTVKTESMGADEMVSETDIVITDTTPHEAWKSLFQRLVNLDENDSVILSITLLD